MERRVYLLQRTLRIATANEIWDPAGVQLFSLSAMVLLALFAIVAPARACTVFYRRVQVGPDFRVLVEDSGRPVEGLRVKTGDIFAVTDKNGFATFSGMRPGSYFVSADLDAGIGDAVDLEIKFDGPTGVTVPLKWPSITPIVVRSLKGAIRGAGYVSGQSQSRLSLELLEATTGRTLRSSQTSETGEFNFESVAPGLYFLSLKPSGLKGWSGEPITGLIVIAVDHNAHAEHLDLDLAWTSCGMQYSDQSKCVRDFQIEMLSGRVIDATGATIPDAKIIVLDAVGSIVDQIQSDGAGGFTSSRSLAGSYEVVVSKPGFAPLRATLQVKPAGEPARPSLFTVQLGIAGSCSSVDRQ